MPGGCMRLIAACGCALAVFTAGADGIWRDDLYSGRGGFWLSRVSLAVTNASPERLDGVPVSLKCGVDIGLRDVSVEELRLVDDDGKELLLGVWENDRRIESGRLPVGSEIVLPVSLPPFAERGYTLYWGNRSAWKNIDFFRERPSGNSGLSVRVGEIRRMSVVSTGGSDPWLADRPGTRWLFRVPVRLANFLDERRPSVMSSFNFHEGVRGVADPVCRLMDGEQEVPLCVIGDTAVFSCSLPPKTIRTLWLYVGKRGDGNAAPPGPAVPYGMSRADAEKYLKTVSGTCNLLRNPLFDEKKGGWIRTGPKDDPEATCAMTGSGGLSGRGFLAVDIDRGRRPAWRGWKQTVGVKPGRMYVFGGFLSCDRSDMRTVIHLHLHGNGEPPRMAASSPGVDRTKSWTASFGVIHASARSTGATLFLTTRGRGRFSYDELILAEYATSALGLPRWRADVAARSAGIVSVQPVNPAVKVFREDPVKNSTKFGVFLARNETEPLQLAVRTSRDVEKLEVEVVPPVGADGTRSLAVETGWVEYVPVDTPSSSSRSNAKAWECKRPTAPQSCDGWAGLWPDPIAPVSAGPVKKGVTQPIWINVTSEKDTPSGVYTGEIRWKADGAVVRRDVFKVRVWDFVLPDAAELPAIFDIHWRNRLQEARDFSGLDGDGRRETMWKFYAKMKICPNSLGNNVKFFRGADGEINADFTGYDRLAERYFGKYRFPKSYMPDCFLCFGWGRPPTPFLGEQPFEGKWPFDGADRSKLRDGYRKTYQDALRLYWNHVKSKGWSDRLVLYISDEPHFSSPSIRQQMKALCTMIHEVDPAIRIYASTWRHYGEWDGFLDIWGAGHSGRFPVSEMKAVRSKGDGLWFTTDGLFCIDTPVCAVERLLPVYCAMYGAQAYENWGSNWFTYDPWQSGVHSYIPETDRPGHHYFIRYTNADGYLMYPGVPGRFKGPVSSIRLESVRDGVEDFGYLKRLETCAGSSGALADRAASLLERYRRLVPVPNAGGRHSKRNLPNPDELTSLRREAGAILERFFARRP